MQSDDKNLKSGGRFEKAFQGVDRFEPYLIRDWLVKNRIVAEVRGFDLGTMGALPNFEEFPSVWVRAEEVENATRLIAAFERPDTSAIPWDCPDCQEESPGEFGSCWNCGADNPKLR